MWKVTAVLCLLCDGLNCINTQYLPKINHDVDRYPNYPARQWYDVWYKNPCIRYLDILD